MVSAAQRKREEEAAAAAELQDAKDELTADPAGGPAADEQAAAAPDAEGGLTPPVTREPEANPKDTTARRARRGRRVVDAAPDPATDEQLRAEAAEVLGCHLKEVLLVEDTDSGPVATTFDGQRYLLTGTARGEYEWLQVKPAVPQLLAGG